MKRPLSVTVIAILFLAVGLITVASGAAKVIRGPSAALNENLLVLSINTLAIVAGIGLLRGSSWARFLVVGWMAFHVILSFWHSPVEVLLHALMLAALCYFLFRHSAARYFTRSTPASSK